MQSRTAQLVTAATWEPITLRELKTQVQLAIDYTDHDVELQQLGAAAREQYERDTQQVIATSSWRVRFDDWPASYFELTLRPVSAIESIQYVDTAGTLQTLASSVYELDADYALPRVLLKDGQQWPSTRAHEGDIRITFTAGYATQSAVPASIKQAVLLLASTWFENRTTLAATDKESPVGYAAMVMSRMRPSYP